MQLTPEEIDDVLYLTRVNEKDELLSFLTELATKQSATQASVLEACVDPETLNTAIHFCGANGLTELLATLLDLLKSDQPAELINKRNDSGNTPLHWASLNGHLETCKALVKAGADMWVRNNAGNLAIFEAERADKDDIVAYLLQVGGTEQENADGSSTFTMAAGEPVNDSGMEVEESSTEIDDAQEKMGETSLND